MPYKLPYTRAQGVKKSVWSVCWDKKISLGEMWSLCWFRVILTYRKQENIELICSLCQQFACTLTIFLGLFYYTKIVVEAIFMVELIM